MTAQPQPNTHSQVVARRLRQLRKARKWSTQYLADLAGINRMIIINIEFSRRLYVTVDELYAFADAFGVPVTHLAEEGSICPGCKDAPPTGFACLVCGTAGGPV